MKSASTRYGIVVQQVVEQRTEQLGIAAREEAAADQVQHLGQHRIARAGLHAAGSRCRHTSATCSVLWPNRKKFSGADLLADLHVRAVQRADGQRAVHRELHVAGAGGFLAGGGDLLGQIGRRVDALPVADIEVRQVHHLEPVADRAVAIDDIAHRS